MIFCQEDLFFELKTPEYEIPTFGGKIGELRLIGADKVYNSDFLLFESLDGYLRDNGYIACTFRGDEDIWLVRFLNDNGFKFVGTFSKLVCPVKMNTHIRVNTDLNVTLACEDDYEGILSVCRNVFDYSTYQMDYDFSLAKMAERNVNRVKSYFTHPKHVCYVIKIYGVVQGFLQFVFEGDKAKCVNGAVAEDYQGLVVGSKLYSDSFSHVFDFWGADTIESGCSNQNIPVLKLHDACGFKIKSQEIHLRLKL